MRNVTSSVHSEVTQKNSHNYSSYHSGTFISLAMENPSRLLISRGVVKPEKLEGAFEMENLGIILDYYMNII